MTPPDPAGGQTHCPDASRRRITRPRQAQAHSPPKGHLQQIVSATSPQRPAAHVFRCCACGPGADGHKLAPRGATSTSATHGRRSPRAGPRACGEACRTRSRAWPGRVRRPPPRPECRFLIARTIPPSSMRGLRLLGSVFHRSSTSAGYLQPPESRITTTCAATLQAFRLWPDNPRDAFVWLLVPGAEFWMPTPRRARREMARVVRAPVPPGGNNRLRALTVSAVPWGDTLPPIRRQDSG
jgi:hypothetical protein